MDVRSRRRRRMRRRRKQVVFEMLGAAVHLSSQPLVDVVYEMPALHLQFYATDANSGQGSP